ncbi:peptidoglycan editing factor PgeF [Proteiniphilum sp.]|uniref:peptidoglycan editing factor PgeF n=1 Tax=Proteiniphilum sp. TaxID=1926877 RepID=UPI002B215CE2|nr:peptidoglycan editing factor PgeF [Proteiniphilum sp.]MEA4917024.1 peptidoglycan editing factor PgeF [Proteiniphilum sp.]
MLLFDLFDREENIVHFTTTREGGVSDGSYSSFNMGNFSDDSPLNISENRAILARMLYMDISRFVIPHQTHGTKVLTIDKTFFDLDHAVAIETLYGVDATITVEKDIFLCATTADCVPIILYDKRNHVIAAIHAGWRGSVGRIVEKTVVEMKQQLGSSPADIIAGIGPAIDVSHYEVGDEVVSSFKNQGFDLSDFSLFPRKNRYSKYHVDLKEINRRELIRLGVPEANIEKSLLCTFEKEDIFFSARRQTVHSGRMLTGIMMNG